VTLSLNIALRYFTEHPFTGDSRKLRAASTVG
jgi:hypothetical protein